MVVCKNLSIGYGKQIVKEGINFEIPSGSYTVVLGDNGAGKTTLVRTIAGLLPPLKGEASVEGVRIGYLPQQTEAQVVFPTVVEEVVLSGMQGMSGLFYKKSDKQKARDVMEKMGILSLAKKGYGELSGGQRQRVLFARALLSCEGLLILDEPITGLDVKNQKMLYDILWELFKEGTSIVMISHDKDVLCEKATYVLSVGEDVVFESKESFLKRRDV